MSTSIPASHRPEPGQPVVGQPAVGESEGTRLVDTFDTLLLDLDGVVYRGTEGIPGVPGYLRQARASAVRLVFVTNNAARAPDSIAGQLSALDVPAAASEVVTSAQAAAGLVTELVPPGGRVLVVGGAGLVDAVTARGLTPVFDAASGPAAVVQGFSPDLRWRDLAEGAYAVAAGIPWVVSNLDPTLPTERGLAPGNGALVELVRATAGVSLPRSAGKPERPLFDEAVRRVPGGRPLVVGDRLDTDIKGAAASGLPSLLVLTGVTGLSELLGAPPGLRPTYAGADLGCLLRPAAKLRMLADGKASCGGWTATIDRDQAVLHGSGDRSDAVRALTTAAWAAPHPQQVDATNAAAVLGVPA